MSRREGESVSKQTVIQTVASNVRAYRKLREFDQAALAQRMQSLGIAWRRATVSDIERDSRNDVTITEMLGLAVALDVTIEQLLDSRGPEGEASPRGPDMIFNKMTDNPDLPPGSVTALICRHRAHAETYWDGHDFQGIAVSTVDDPPKPLYMGSKVSAR
jgi:transcriptional regulator with XRE-family HTH domain